MEPLRVSPNRSFSTDYEETYYRVIFSLFGLAYLFSFYYKGPDTSPLLEFVIPRNIFAILPFVLLGLSYILQVVKKHIKDIGSGFFLLSTLHLVGFFSINNFNTHYEIGIITLVLFSNLHLNKVLYIVLYNVIVLTALEYVFITASVAANIQPVLFFLFLLSVMLICIFYQLYRIRFNSQVNERDQLLSGIISGNPESWMIFEGPGLIARDASSKAMKVFGVNDYNELEQVSLRTIIVADSVSASDEIIRNILSNQSFEIKTQCRTQDGTLFYADVSAFTIPGNSGFIHCRFIDISDNRAARDIATENAIRYRSYLENINEGIIICDVSGEIKLINKPAIQLLKRELSESFTGKTIIDYAGEETGRAILSVAAKGQSDYVEIEPSDYDHKGLIIAVKRTIDLINHVSEIFIRLNTHEISNEIVPQDQIQLPVPEPEKIFVTDSKQQSLMLNTGIPVFITNDQNGITEFNEAFELLTEYSKSELLSLNFKNLLHPKDLFIFNELITEIIKTKASSKIELHLISKRGRVKTLQLNCAAFFNEKGEINFVSIANDITNFKKTEQELILAGSNVTAVIENTEAPIFSLDYNNRITVLNTAFAKECFKRTGRIPNPGDDYRNFLTDANKVIWNSTIPKVMRGSVIRRDEIITYTDGTTDYFEVSYYPITSPTNTIIGVSVLSQKVTERVNFESELVKSKDIAESATKIKSEFLATMSHEIRTPLNGLLGMSDLLNTTKLNTRQQEFVNSIKLSGEALLSIINNVLDYSRIESDKMELEDRPFELKECIEETFDILYYKAVEKGNHLSYTIAPEISPFISGDKARLRQILVNLVGNAVKFTSNGQISISVTLENEINGKYEIRFAVKDTGVGMTADQMDKLFQSFSQADTSTFRKYGGSGLGLTISARLTALMNGKIWAESESGKGSTFYFTIMAQRSDGIANSVKGKQKNKLNPGTSILMLSDNVFSKSKLVSYGLDWKAKIKIAESVVEALQYLNDTIFNFIIIDFSSSKINIEDTIKQLKASSKVSSETPIIGINKNESEVDTDNLEVNNAFDFILTELPSSVQFSSLITEIINKKAKHNIPTETLSKFPIRILVAEDNAVNQTIAKISLQQLGHEPEMVSNGKEAVTHALKNNYDIIFMDVQMPEMDGLEATKKIIAEKKTGTTPVIIAMTAFAMEGDKEKCIAAGMSDYVSKPIKIEDFKSMIQKWGPEMLQTNQPDKSSEPNLDSEDLIDMKLFNRLMDMGIDDPEFIQQLIQLYVDQSKDTIVEIEKTALEKDFEQIGQIGHKLKGSSLNLGARKLAEICKNIELASKTENSITIASEIENLKKIYPLTIYKLMELTGLK